MSKRFFCLWLSLFCLFTAACGQKGGTWAVIEERGVLYVGLDPTYPPFELADGGPLVGIDVDLAQAIGHDLGLQVEFVYFGYDGLYDALATKQVDILLSALVIMPTQTKDFAYSDSYFNAGQVLLTSEASIEQMEDLNGRSLAVELGAEGHVIATRWTRRVPDLTVLTYESPDAATTAVVEGEATAVLIDSISGHLFRHNNPSAQLYLAPQPVTVEPYALVTRIEDERLLDQLNQSLARLRTNGQLAAILEMWLGESAASIHK